MNVKKMTGYLFLLLTISGCQKTAGPKTESSPSQPVKIYDTRIQSGFIQSEISEDARPYPAYVTTDILNVREEASITAPIVAKLSQNEVVTVLRSSKTRETIDGQTGTWLSIDRGSLTGFVFSSFLEKLNGEENYRATREEREFRTGSFNNSLDQARSDESEIHRRFPNLFERKETTLSIAINGNSTKVFLDNSSEVKGIKYSVVDYFLGKYITVETQFYEGTNHILLDLETGASCSVAGSEKRVRSDQKFVCFVDGSLEREFSNTPGLEIVDLKNMKVVYTNEQAANDAMWMENGDLEVVFAAFMPDRHSAYRYKQMLSQKTGTWEISSEKRRI